MRNIDSVATLSGIPVQSNAVDLFKKLNIFLNSFDIVWNV